MRKSNPAYRSIPEPTANPKDLMAAVQALKQNVEVLMGIRGSRGFANQVFIVRARNQNEIPLATKDGDIWLIPPLTADESWQLSVWRNETWEKVVFT